MSKIIISRAGTELGQYSMAEVEHLSAARYLQPDDHYWREGMPEWQPLGELTGNRALAVSSPQLPPTFPPQPAAGVQQPVVVNVYNHNHAQAAVQTPVAMVVGNRKSGLLAALLNLLIPGLGYMYCGRFLLGIIAFILAVLIVGGTAGAGAIFIYPILFIDGFLSARRANRNVVVIVR